MLVELRKSSQLSLKVCFKIQTPILSPEWAISIPEGIWGAQMMSPRVWPLYKDSVSGHSSADTILLFKCSQEVGIQTNYPHNPHLLCLKNPRVTHHSASKEGPIFTAKGILEHSLQPKSSSCHRPTPDSLNGSIHLLLHSNSPVHQQEPKSHTAYSSPGERARLGTTLTSIQDIFPSKSPSLPSWCWLPALGIPISASWSLQSPNLSATFCWGLWGLSMALADPNPCHLQQRSPLCTALGVGSGLGRSLVLEQLHFMGGSSGSRIRHEARLGWKLWMCAAVPGSVAHCS